MPTPNPLDNPLDQLKDDLKTLREQPSTSADQAMEKLSAKLTTHLVPFQVGLDANRPGQPGNLSKTPENYQFYFATDTGKLYFYNGTIWLTFTLT